MAEIARFGFFGRSQSGKSTILDRIMRPHKRVVLFDPLPARASNAAAEGFAKIEHISELQRAVQANYETGFRFWFKPENEEDFLQQSLSDLSYFLINHQDQYAERYGYGNIPEILFGVDEMSDCFPNQLLKKDCNGFSKMCRAGRHSLIHTLGATQRPAEVSTKFRGQLNRRYLFNLTEAADLRHVEEIGGIHGKELALAVSRLKSLEFIRMENNTFTPGKLTF